MAAAAATAAGVIVGAYIQHRSANNAIKAQRKAGDDALAYEKEQDQYLRSRMEKQDSREDEARAGYKAYLASQGQGGGGAAPENMNPVAVAARNFVMQPGQGAKPEVSGQPAQTTIRDVASMYGAPPQTDQTIQPRTLADLSKWNQWSEYGA